MGETNSSFEIWQPISSKTRMNFSQAIRLGLATGIAEHIERASHSLRGLAANFDAESIVAIAGSIEEMARKGELEMGASRC